jgi:integrase
MPKVKGTPTVRFILQSTLEPKVKTYVFLYFVYKGKRLKYSTGIKVRPDAWTNARANAKCPERADINEDLAKMERFTIEIFRETAGKIEPIEFRLELDYRMGYKERPEVLKMKVPTLLEYLENEIKAKQMNEGKQTAKQALSRLYGQLSNFSKEKNIQLEFIEINRSLLNEFKTWLLSEPRSYHPNYLNKLYSVFKMCMTNAKENHHSNTVFDYYKLGTEVSKVEISRISLSFDELENLYNLDLSNNLRLEKARDLFLIGAYTGLRVSDFSRICPEHINIIKGKKYIAITAKKTGQKVLIPLFVILENLLGKYDGTSPKLSDQKMNDYIKEVGQLVGLNDNTIILEYVNGVQKETIVEKWTQLVNHTARRSFITNFVKLNVPIKDIMAITGHKREDTFRIYNCIDNEEAVITFGESVEKISNSPNLMIARG